MLAEPHKTVGKGDTMTKQQTIEMIRQRNQSASAEFLTRFDEGSLDVYLRRLATVCNHRGRSSRWVRDTDSPAVTTRVHRTAA